MPGTFLKTSKLKVTRHFEIKSQTLLKGMNSELSIALHKK